MDPARDGSDVVLYLEAEPGDGPVPRRRLYWLHLAPLAGGWRARVPEATWESWKAQWVPADMPEGADKMQWRLATRFAQVRHRGDAVGVSPPVLGDVTFERVEG
ncbi:MAG: hypothetical protein H6734_13045 [Alphaproteobacteria bacterium]|nr:hypothetical protein [Alphaproteobacteria bacterium]